MLSGKDFGMAAPAFRRLAGFYLAVQAAIWVKVAAFFFLFGKGTTPAYNMFFLSKPEGFPAWLQIVFSSPLYLFDGVFHQVAHALIAACVFALARDAKNANPLNLLPLFLLASLAHNIGYWLTGVFPSASYAFIDYLNDVLFLYAFFYAFKIGLWLLPQLRRLRFPAIDY